MYDLQYQYVSRKEYHISPGYNSDFVTIKQISVQTGNV